jgi:polyisoprenoid-binding protein YceI
MKTLSLLKILPVVVLIALFVSNCEENEVTPFNNIVTSGDETVSSSGGWNFEKNHSTVRWETMYHGDHAFVTGRFDDFAANIEFDEADPASTDIDIWVRLSECYTSEPGRDNLGGCMNGYLGVEHNGDTLMDGSLDPAGIVSSTDTAWFKSKSTVKYGDGYLTKGDFTFRGVTDEVELFFRYYGRQEYTSFSGAVVIKSSFQGEFIFKAKSVFGVDTDNIGSPDGEVKAIAELIYNIPK